MIDQLSILQRATTIAIITIITNAIATQCLALQVASCLSGSYCRSLVSAGDSCKPQGRCFSGCWYRNYSVDIYAADAARLAGRPARRPARRPAGRPASTTTPATQSPTSQQLPSCSRYVVHCLSVVTIWAISQATSLRSPFGGLATWSVRRLKTTSCNSFVCLSMLLWGYPPWRPAPSPQ